MVFDHWRLNGEGELYDISKDPGQTKDIASQHPEMVKTLKDHYDQFWASIEDSIEVVEPVVVGHDAEPFTELTCNNWVEVDFDNRGRVAGGQSMGGIWQIEAERSGTYKVELARWPFYMNRELTVKGPATTIGGMPIDEGVAFPIAGGSISLDGANSIHSKSNQENTLIEFELSMDTGRHTLQGWFHDQAGNKLAGAFYARVTKV